MVPLSSALATWPSRPGLLDGPLQGPFPAFYQEVVGLGSECGCGNKKPEARHSAFSCFPQSQRRPGHPRFKAREPSVRLPPNKLVTPVFSLLGSRAPAQVFLALGLTIRYLPPAPLSAFFGT